MHSGAILTGAYSIYHTSGAVEGERIRRNETFSGLEEESIVTDL